MVFEMKFDSELSSLELWLSNESEVYMTIVVVVVVVS